MANWNEIRAKVGNAASKAAKKTEEIAQTTAKYVKLKSLDSKISSKFEVLGKLTYKQIKDEESQAERIARVIDEIDSLRAQRKALKDEIEADKQRRADEKAAQQAADSVCIDEPTVAEDPAEKE